ncbi:hypothetical protein KM043_011991 [Ampulex compressa]|nr:hypothetical protein KM043_011991 [Ampulex compressa]
MHRSILKILHTVLLSYDSFAQATLHSEPSSPRRSPKTHPAAAPRAELSRFIFGHESGSLRASEWGLRAPWSFQPVLGSSLEIVESWRRPLPIKFHEPRGRRGFRGQSWLAIAIMARQKERNDSESPRTGMFINKTEGPGGGEDRAAGKCSLPRRVFLSRRKSRWWPRAVAPGLIILRDKTPKLLRIN